jgi:L-amino acid N-acyltransferase
MRIRMAEEKDLPAVTDIYNEVLRTSTAIYRDEETTLEERVQWWQNQRQKGYPLLVAEEDDEVLGFASYGDFRPWPGYRFTVEGSIHLRPDARRHGTGTLLLQDLIADARAAGKHMLIAGIDAENLPSQRFMEKIGAKRTAHLKEVGFKFGRYLDLLLYQIRLS